MSVVKEGFVLEVVQRYESDHGMLIPMMQDLQAEYGYLPPEELRRLAGELGVPLSRVYGVAMFYSSFRLAPKGQHDVTLCMGTVCYLKGSPKVSEAICAEYGIKPGGTTPDRLFTLQAVNCVGACALAPVMVVDGKYYDGVTPDSALEVLRGLVIGGGEEIVRAEISKVESQPSIPAAEPGGEARRRSPTGRSAGGRREAGAEPAFGGEPSPEPIGPLPTAKAKPAAKAARAPKPAKPAIRGAKAKTGAKPAAKAPKAAKPAAGSKPAAKKAKAVGKKTRLKPKAAATKRSRP
jgi:NADH:ubiquinone oxidoreductase subunit E